MDSTINSTNPMPTDELVSTSEQGADANDIAPTSIKELIFSICENLQTNKQKITRNKVQNKLKELRNGKGASNRDLSKYIKDWKEQQGTANETEASEEDAEIEQEAEEDGSALVTTGGEIVTAPQEEINIGAESLQAEASLPPNQMQQLIRGAAEQATGTMIAQTAIAGYYIQNPHELPEDLRQQVEEAQTNFTSLQRRRYNPTTIINQAMTLIQKKAG